MDVDDSDSGESEEEVSSHDAFRSIELIVSSGRRVLYAWFARTTGIAKENSSVLSS